MAHTGVPKELHLPFGDPAHVGGEEVGGQDAQPVEALDRGLVEPRHAKIHVGGGDGGMGQEADPEPIGDPGRADEEGVAA